MRLILILLVVTLATYLGYVLPLGGPDLFGFLVLCAFAGAGAASLPELLP